MKRAITSAGLAAAVLCFVVSVVSTIGPAAAERGRSRYGYESAPRYVVAESRFGNGTIEGPIRPGPKGWQVRLPRGTWIDCVRSCSDTLRRATVDFWQNQGQDAPDLGRGYIDFEFRF